MYANGSGHIHLNELSELLSYIVLDPEILNLILIEDLLRNDITFKTKINSMIASQIELMDLLENIGLFTIAIGFISWLIKLMISKHYDKELEAYKSELDKSVREYQKELEKNIRDHQQKLDIEIENERNELKLQFAKYSRIYEERLNMIRNLYRMIVDLRAAMNELTMFMWPSTGESKKERRERIIKQANDCYYSLKNTFVYQRIMFNEDTCKLMDEMLDQISTSIHLDTFEEQWGPGGKEAIQQFKDEASNIVDTKIPAILSELEADFREQLGTVN